MFKKINHTINNETFTILTTTRQKDILDTLDEMIENAERYGWDYIFSDASFIIEYKDGTTYQADVITNEGTYKKRNISRIIYTNENDIQVYGNYEINKYGYVA